MTTPVVIAIAAAAAVVFGILGFVIGSVIKRKTDEGIVISAKEQAKNIINDAMKTAEAKKKEAVLEAKDEVYKLRSEADREIRERRNEVQRQERRIVQKEETLDKKIENLEAKEEKLAEKSKEIDKSMEEVAQLKKSQMDVLERISGFSIQQAKDFLLKSLEDELTHEKALKISIYEQQLKDESDRLASNIISGAIQRCAADHSSEATISVVGLPNDEMKGRIIGREGRNIRALETLTGVDLIIEHTRSNHTFKLRPDSPRGGKGCA